MKIHDRALDSLIEEFRTGGRVEIHDELDPITKTLILGCLMELRALRSLRVLAEGIDTMTPEQMAVWLRHRVRANRQNTGQRLPDGRVVLEEWRVNLLSHIALRLEQAAVLLDYYAARLDENSPLTLTPGERDALQAEMNRLSSERLAKFVRHAPVDATKPDAEG